MEMVNGQTVSTAFVSVHHGEVRVYVHTGVVEHAEAGVMRLPNGEARLVARYVDSIFPSEAEARSWAASRLEQIAATVEAEAKKQREAAAEVAAKAAVVYA